MLPTAGQDAVKQNIERWRQAWRVSLLDLLAVSDLDAELGWREKIYASIGEANIKAALHNAEAVSIAALQKLVCLLWKRESGCRGMFYLLALLLLCRCLALVTTRLAPPASCLIRLSLPVHFIQKPGEPSQCISPFLEFCAVTSRFGVLKVR